MNGSNPQDPAGSPGRGGPSTSPAPSVPPARDAQVTREMPTAGQQPGPADGPSAPGPTADGPAGASPAGEAPDGQPTAGGATAPGTHRAKSRAPQKKKNRSFWKELPALVVVALILTLIIKTYAIQAFFIPSGSMQNTLAIGDRVLVNKLVYDVRSIHRGDIVVFSGNGSWNPGVAPKSTNVFTKFGNSVLSMFGLEQNQNDYIKRVIGLPGDHVACCDAQGRVTVNDIPLSEQSYLFPGNPPSETRFSITVPSGRLWVMGDHRDVSYDSRGHVGDPGGGTIPENAVVGRAFIVIWPVSQWRILGIPSTFQQPKLNASPGTSQSARQAQEAAVADAGLPAHPAAPALPFALGFAGAVPLTWVQRKVRRRVFAGRPFPRPRLRFRSRTHL
jgi:signal peptidase I